MTQKRPHICFVTTGDIVSIATAKRALGLANHLHDLGWRVSVLMQDTEENRHRVGMECNEHIETHYFPWMKAGEEQRWKNRKIADIDPDVLYVCAFVGRNIVGRRHRCIKIVEHSELQSKFKEVSFPRRCYHYACEFYSLFYSDGIVNASRYLQDIFLRRARRCGRRCLPQLYLPYAYNKDVCYVATERALQLIDKQPNHRYCVFMGSLTENYGAFTMLQAFEKIAQTTTDIKLLLCGRGRDFLRVKDYVEQHGLKKSVRLMGYVAEEDIPVYFSLADAFLLPLHDTVQDWARCPSKLYMYLPYRKPVITCKIGEPFEVLGEKGTYFAPGDADSLAKAILDMAAKDQWTLDIEPEQHEWKSRAEKLNEWMKSQMTQ